MSIVEKMADAAAVAQQINEECTFGDMLRAAFAATGLTEAQLEGLATGTHVVVLVKSAAQDVLAERERQKSAEGWTPEHDDEHSCGELADAAACYACPAPHGVRVTAQDDPPRNWPWHRAWWKPSTRRRNLVKAGALILAEIERLDRAAGLTEAQLEGLANGDLVILPNPLNARERADAVADRAMLAAKEG